MNTIHAAIHFLRSEDGPTAVEYATMLALIVVVALGAITLLGQKVSSVFTNADGVLPAGNRPRWSSVGRPIEPGSVISHLSLLPQ